MMSKEKCPRKDDGVGNKPAGGQRLYDQQLHSPQPLDGKADFLSTQAAAHRDGPMNVDIGLCRSEDVVDVNVDINVDIYVATHCLICDYSHEIADYIREQFPQVALRMIDIEAASEPIPEAVFATPTYMLNGRVWSLGNPSPTQVSQKLQDLLETGR